VSHVALAVFVLRAPIADALRAGGRTKPRADARDRLLELHYIARKLREFLTPDGVEVWLHSRNSWLDDRKPVDVLAKGHFDEVLRVIAQISNGEH
jgi:hypothetical protein